MCKSSTLRPRRGFTAETISKEASTRPLGQPLVRLHALLTMLQGGHQTAVTGTGVKRHRTTVDDLGDAAHRPGVTQTVGSSDADCPRRRTESFLLLTLERSGRRPLPGVARPNAPPSQRARCLCRCGPAPVKGSLSGLVSPRDRN